MNTRHARLARLTLTLSSLAAVLSACGVEPKGGSAPRKGEPIADTTAHFGPSDCEVFAPTAIRIHPLTRLVVEKTEGAAVQAHIELTDRWGDSVKWLGTMVFELYRDAPAGGGVAGGQEQINVWSLDLSDPDANAKAYDRVTRTYRATLTEVGVQPRSRLNLSLRVGFNSPEGRQLTATHRLEAQ